MRASNPKKLTRNSFVDLDDAALEKIQYGGDSCHEGNILKHQKFSKEVTNNVPDVVSDINKPSASSISIDVSKDPDIVSSNFSSDDTFLNARVSSDGTVLRPKYLRIIHDSVSSFSSSDSSKQSTNSDTKQKISTIGSSCSADYENHDEILIRESDKDCLLNQDSVFIEENDVLNQDSVFIEENDVFDQQQQLNMQQMYPVNNIASPIMNPKSSQSSTHDASGAVISCYEEGRKARNHYRSSGCGTGSGDSHQKSTTFKVSTQSQESISKEDPAVPQVTQTHIFDTEEIKCVENDFIPRNIRPYSTTVNYVTNQSKLHPESVPSPPSNKNHNSSNITLGGERQEITIKHSSNNLSEEVNHPHESFEVETNGRSQQELHIQNVPVIAGFSQVNTLHSTVVQSPRQYKINVSGAAIQCLQVPPQVGIINTSLTSLEQQSHLYRKSSMINFPHHISTLSSIQHHLTNSGVLNDNTSQMSSSSSSSCYIPHSAECRWLAEPSHVSIAKLLLLQSGSVVSESSGESRYHLESLINNDARVSPTQPSAEVITQQSVSSQGMPNFNEPMSNSLVLSNLSSVLMSSLEGQFDRDLWEKLQRSVRCHETECVDADCMQVKKVVTLLQDVRHPLSSLCVVDKMMLLMMFNHMVYLCDHPKCPFPWCGEHIDIFDQISQDNSLLIMKKRMENFAEHCVLFNRPVKYMKLNPKLSYLSMPVEGQDWIRLCMLGNSRRSVLVQPIKSENSDLYSETKYWVIKKISTTDDGDHWGLYARLREVNHTSIVTFMWAASFEDHMLVCTIYENFSLHEYLPSLPPSQIRFVPIFRLMHQLMSAVQHLNSLGIVYLYWISKNILVTYYTAEDFVVKLSNFSCSVLLEPPDGKQPCYDGGYLLLALPRHIITPELRDNIRVEFASDVWGLGCLLNELVTGYPVWYEHRHVVDNDFKKLVCEKPNIPTICPELEDVFAACWEVESSKRVLLSDLEIMLIHAFHVHLTGFN